MIGSPNAGAANQSVAIGIGVFALILASIGLFRADGAPRAVDESRAPDTLPALDDLTRRVVALEQRTEPRVVVPTSAIERTERASLQDPRVDDLASRVARLEAESARRDPGSVAESPRVAADDLERRRVAQQQLVATARNAILDPRATEAAKLEGWKQLRNGGPDAWTDAIVDEMVRIGLTSNDVNVRADVWRQADANARSERLVPGLLQALTGDADGRVREEAAETLENYAKLPQVRLALEAAAVNDPEEKVRRFARQSIEKGSR
ncbi:MAG: HEAT repeat domain-containing protein [Planctomycetes bacterium]|nr:HEAT repeat domain-containing protein [Planctomycetota bacterium]